MLGMGAMELHLELEEIVREGKGVRHHHIVSLFDS